jgi:aminoglycoside phosphotransferase (APT) family kinase protein
VTRTADHGETGDLQQGLRAYLQSQGVVDADVSDLRRLTGGSTHDTWAFDLQSGPPTARVNEPLILRRNLAHDSLDMSPEAEFRLLQWLHDREVPVARPWLCSPDGANLRMPFVISERANGVDLRKFMAKAGPSFDRSATGTMLVSLQARIHNISPASLPEGLLAPPDVAGEVERWTRPLLALRGQTAHPLVRAAVTWLQANVPHLDTPGLVHGDFKANNILWTSGDRPVLLDWELAHVGDPIEDLGWTMLWMTKDDLVCGMLSPAEYIAAYEAETGQRVDRKRLFFWQCFALVKLSGIMLSGNNTAAADGALSPSHALLSRGVSCLETALADYMLSASKAGYL